MKFAKILLFVASIAAFSSCSSAPRQGITETANAVSLSRSIAASAIGGGITFPSNATFDLHDHAGKTYKTFVKNHVKPALDRLSDKSNAGGGGFDNIGAAAFQSQASALDAKTLAGYKGAKWDRVKRAYVGDLPDAVVANVYNTLKKVKPHSTVDSLTYFDRNDKAWPAKNDMAIALKEANVRSAPFDLATLYALTGGIGVKVKLDSRNYNYHVLYKTGHTKPHEEVMSGRSFASSPEHGAADATDPEYLRDLQKYLSSTPDQRPFYRALIQALAACDTSGWSQLSNLGQSVLSDFLTVYTAEADRHAMVDFQDGNHPWEIDLAAVTFVSAVSEALGKVVVGGALQEGDLGKWFAPSPNNKPDGPQRSGIGITRKDRQKFQRAIHHFEMSTSDGRKLIEDIQAITGNRRKNDVIQGVFEFLSNRNTPQTLGTNAQRLADLMSEFIALARADAAAIAGVVPTIE